MDPTRILEADHRQAEELFGQIEAAEGDDRLPFIEQLTTALRAHMELEEQVVYPAMRPIVGAESVQEGNTEHALARKAMMDVEALAPNEPGFGAALDALKAGIEHHVTEEEGEVFPQMRNEGSGVLDEVSTPFMAKRLEVGLAIEPEALAAASTKEELVDEAGMAGIEGATSMTKAELAEALATHMA